MLSYFLQDDFHLCAICYFFILSLNFIVLHNIPLITPFHHLFTFLKSHHYLITLYLSHPDSCQTLWQKRFPLKLTPYLEIHFLPLTLPALPSLTSTMLSICQCLFLCMVGCWFVCLSFVCSTLSLCSHGKMYFLNPIIIVIIHVEL